MKSPTSLWNTQVYLPQFYCYLPPSPTQFSCSARDYMVCTELQYFLFLTCAKGSLPLYSNYNTCLAGKRKAHPAPPEPRFTFSFLFLRMIAAEIGGLCASLLEAGMKLTNKQKKREKKSGCSLLWVSSAKKKRLICQFVLGDGGEGGKR